jgi:hypothetical protein
MKWVAFPSSCSASKTPMCDKLLGAVGMASMENNGVLSLLQARLPKHQCGINFFGAVGIESMEKVEIIDILTARYGGCMDVLSHI